MLSKARIKLIHSLAHKKYRNELKLFVVEGKKQVTELFTSNLNIKLILATPNWLTANTAFIKNQTEICEVSEDELKKVSFLTTPQEVLALVELPKPIQNPTIGNGLTLALDTIQDPGNLGTIIRIADWYGIQNIICSQTCADVYSPKVIQATMGSFMRVGVHYIDLYEFLNQTSMPVYGAFIGGKSIHQTKLSTPAILVIGNEGNGISADIHKVITHPISIPRFGSAESLNAAIATAIICDAFARI